MNACAFNPSQIKVTRDIILLFSPLFHSHLRMYHPNSLFPAIRACWPSRFVNSSFQGCLCWHLERLHTWSLFQHRLLKRILSLGKHFNLHRIIVGIAYRRGKICCFRTCHATSPFPRTSTPRLLLLPRLLHSFSSRHTHLTAYKLFASTHLLHTTAVYEQGFFPYPHAPVQ